MSPQWIVTKVDGAIASVSVSYSGAARILSAIKKLPVSSVGEFTCTKVSTEELFSLSEGVKWEDLRLFGSQFQKDIWHALFNLTHGGGEPRLMSYTDFAESIGKGPGVRAVAHAIGLNPIPVIIPCHLIIPKESIERLHAIQSENGLFSWKALYIVDSHIDYGEYALGASLKRELILRHIDR